MYFEKEINEKISKAKESLTTLEALRAEAQEKGVSAYEIRQIYAAASLDPSSPIIAGKILEKAKTEAKQSSANMSSSDREKIEEHKKKVNETIKNVSNNYPSIKINLVFSIIFGVFALYLLIGMIITGEGAIFFVALICGIISGVFIYIRSQKIEERDAAIRRVARTDNGIYMGFKTAEILEKYDAMYRFAINRLDNVITNTVGGNALVSGMPMLRHHPLKSSLEESLTDISGDYNLREPLYCGTGSGAIIFDKANRRFIICQNFVLEDKNELENFYYSYVENGDIHSDNINVIATVQINIDNIISCQIKTQHSATTSSSTYYDGAMTNTENLLRNALIGQSRFSGTLRMSSSSKSTTVFNQRYSLYITLKDLNQLGIDIGTNDAVASRVIALIEMATGKPCNQL